MAACGWFSNTEFAGWFTISAECFHVYHWHVWHVSIMSPIQNANMRYLERMSTSHRVEWMAQASWTRSDLWIVTEIHFTWFSPSDVVSSTMSLWGAGRRTRNLQEAWDWREALVVPGRIDGLKWLSWDIRDACVSFGGMIGKLSDPFSTQSVVEKRFQRQLRWLFSDNRRFCCLKAFKRWLGQLC